MATVYVDLFVSMSGEETAWAERDRWEGAAARLRRGAFHRSVFGGGQPQSAGRNRSAIAGGDPRNDCSLKPIS